ncbi:MAG: hypothetical protein KC621_15570, partial [Myxococcales bacterium]|nr:hypothetical protein [Myxococcales bacterium]
MSPIRRFLAWWLSELRAMLPGGGHRDAGLGSGRRVRVTVDEHAGVVSRVDGSRVRELGRLPGPAAPPDPSGVAPVVDLGRLSPRDTPCELAVASELALSKEVDLPGAAQENLGEVLAFEMERLTPFRAADVLYDYRVLGRRDGGKRVRVRLSVVPRRLVAPALAAFPGWDLRAVTGAGVEPGDGGEVRLLLRSARYRERGGTWLVGILALVNLG